MINEVPARRRIGLAMLALLALAIVPVDAADGAPMWVFVGTYTGPKSQGIYRLEFDPSTGNLSKPELAAEVPSPSFLAIAPDRTHLYAVAEVGKFDGKPTGAVHAFALNSKDGSLKPLNVESSGGSGPCYIVTDAAGEHVLVANYGGGSVAVLPIGADGKLGAASAFVQHTGSGADTQRQEAPHAHSINLDKANRYAVAADLGLDKLLVYKYDADKGTLEPNDPPATTIAPGSGPRHFAFHPDGRHAYAINEMRLTVTALDYDPAAGTLKEIQTITTLPEGANREGASTAEVQVHPSGKFVYGSNRGHDTIAIFAVNPDGTLKAVGHQPTGGKTPRNFGIDPTGRYLIAANQDSDSLVVFAIDPETGRLKPTGAKAEVGTPVCVKFVLRGE